MELAPSPEDAAFRDEVRAFIAQNYPAEIDPDKLNVNGGSIAIGHPYDMAGSRLTRHLLIEGRWCKTKYGVGGGMGAAGLFEIVN